MPRHILVTGGTGFLGTCFTKRLIEAGDVVRVLDRRPLPDVPAHDPLWSAEYLVGDVTDEGLVDAALDDIDIIVHLAAETSIVDSMRFPHKSLSNNSIGTCTLAQQAKDRVGRFVLASSRAVYGEGCGECIACGRVPALPRLSARTDMGEWECCCPSCGREVAGAPASEDDLLQPASFYGLSKRIQEDAARLILSDSATELVVLRFFNVYGPGESLADGTTRVVTALAQRALRGEPILLTEDGNQSRDFVYIADALDAAWCGLEHCAGTFNVGSGIAMTLLKLAEMMCDLLGRPFRFTLTRQARPGDIRYSQACTRHIAEAWNWKSTTSLEQGLDRFLQSIAAANALS